MLEHAPANCCTWKCKLCNLHIGGSSEIFIATVGSNCASGFPDMDLITNRAAQIESDSQVGMTVDSDRFYLMHTMSFNCTGNITSLILRAEIRTVTGSGQRAGISYPNISLWSPGVNNQLGHVYTKVDGSERSIVLGPSNFSTSGVLEYPLDPPIHFENGNMLGWLQQEEVVQMYRTHKTDFATTSFFNPTSDVLEVTQGTILYNETLSIYPVTGELSLLYICIYTWCIRLNVYV